MSNEKIEKTIELYPSNWLYNAGVIGFLRVLEWGKRSQKFKVKSGFKIKDGKVRINKDIIGKSFELRTEFHREVLGDEKGGAVWGSKGKYPNYIQKNRREFFKNIFVPKLSTLERKGNCSFCDGYFLPLDKINFLKEEWEGDKESFESFMEQREKFQAIHLSYLASSIGGMPNSFWDLNQSLPICHLCSYLVIFHHLAFTQTSDGEIFINAPDFRVMWYLNKFVREVASKETQAQKLFGLSLMQWAIRINQMLGCWTMANIEVIRKYYIGKGQKRKTVIDHFDLPVGVIRILMDPSVANILTYLNLWPILELVMKERFSELLSAMYCAGKAMLMIENQGDIPDNHCITKYGGNKDNAWKMFQNLPYLFARIKEIIKESTMFKKEYESPYIVLSPRKGGCY